MDGRAVTLELLGTNEQEIAYIAGFLDGDGCIMLIPWKRKQYLYYCLRVTASNVFSEPLYLIQRIFGGKVKLYKSREGCNDAYEWRIASRKAETFLTVVLPYLIIKKEEATLALQHAALRGVKTPRKAELAKQVKALKSRNRLLNPR